MREPWDRPCAIGFADPIEADPIPLYWWLRETETHTFVGFCLWYDKDQDHQYDFQGFGYWLPQIGGGQPMYSWLRRHWSIDIYLGRVNPIFSTSGKHSMKPKGEREGALKLDRFQVDESTNLDSALFRGAAEQLQRLMGGTAQLPENWEDLRVKTWAKKRRWVFRNVFKQTETRGLIFRDPGALLAIKQRLGDVKTMWR